MKYKSLLRKSLIAVFVLMLGNASFAQSFPLSIGTIPKGDSIIVINQVTINSPFTNPGLTFTNQHKITGSNFAQVLSNDPKTAAPNDPTVTTVIVQVTIGCPAPVTVPNTVGLCGAVVNGIGPNVSNGTPPYNVSYTITGTGITANTSTTDASGTFFNVGVHTVTYDVTDADLNTATCSFTVTVNDTGLPTISCPAAATLGTNTGCTYVGSIGTATVTDNCGTPTITSDAPAAFPLGNTTVTWRSTDAAGNSVTCTQIITVVDDDLPTISCPVAITIGTNTGCTYVGPIVPAATGTDNCGAPTITNDAPAAFPLGNTTVTWRSTDAAGNSVTCTQVITVVDDDLPTISCPAAATIGTNTGCTYVGPIVPAATGTDNCGAPTITNNAPAAFPLGNTTVTWRSTDAAGNSVTCTQVITVVDDDLPTISCPAAATIGTNTGCTYVGPIVPAATGTDNCGAPTITNDAPASFPLGATTVTWRATDAAGNSVTCTQVITVVDDDLPTISCPAPITFGTNTGCTYVGPIGTATGTDNCVTPTITNNAPSAFPPGTTTVTWRSTDAAGNSVTCTQVVTVVDDDLPTISCPAAATFGTNTGCTYVGLIGTATGTDNCGTPTITNNAPAAFPLGNTTVTWRSTDAAGNSVTCTQVITVVDDDLPAISCPPAATIGTNTGCTYVGPIVPAATGTDNCGTPTITNTAPSIFPLGNTTVTWRATDAAGNSVTCTQVITVVDDDLPTISCPPAATIGTNTGCTYVGPIGIATGTDNCGTPTITNNAPAAFPLGTTTVTWRSSDAAGNSVTCTQVITVVDDDLPTISCPAAVILGTNTGCTYVGPIGIPTVTDNCGTPTITNNAPAAFPLGNTTVTWRSTDAAGNSVTCTQVVTIVDDDLPTISCPAAVTLGTNTGCTYVGLIGTATGTDNCGTPTITNNAPGIFPLGATTVTWRATDAAGNSVTCTQVVTIVDDDLPTISCPAAATFGTNTGCTYVGPIGTATGTDNCGTPTITNNAPAAFPLGNTTITWRSTDAAGNSVTCTQVITVVDDDLPTISCPAAVTIGTNTGCTYVGPIVPAATGTDNCGAPTISNNAPVTFPLGATTVTWRATDAAGNSVTCTQVVTVVDDDAPVIVCPNSVTVTANNDGSCTATGVVLGNATATDNCTPAGSIIITNNAPVSFPVGVTVVTWTAVDAAGNSSTCSKTVTVIAFPGYMNQPASQTVCANAMTAPVNFSSTPAIPGVVYNWTNNNASIGLSAAGTGNIPGFTAINNSNTVQVATITVTPVTACPGSTNTPTIFTITVNPKVMGTVTGAPVTDICNGQTAVVNINLQGIPVFNGVLNLAVIAGTGTPTTINFSRNAAGATTVTIPASSLENLSAPVTTYRVTLLSLTDGSNCPVTLAGSVDINVYPQTSISVSNGPGSVCPGSAITFNVTSAQSGTFNWQAHDGNSVIASGNNTPFGINAVNYITNPCPYNKTLTFTFTPIGGNCPGGSPVTRTVLVQDLIAPTFTVNSALQNTTIACTNTAAIAAARNYVPSATDNCDASPTITEVESFAPGCGNSGTYTTVFTVTDDCGNTATVTQVVTVTDTTPPVIGVIAPQTLNTGNCTGVIPDYISLLGLVLSTTDCGLGVSFQQLAPYAPGTSLTGLSGTITIVIQATDGCGNSSTGSFTVTLVNQGGPAINCPANINMNTNAAGCKASVQTPNPVITGNCGTTTLQWTITGATSGSGTGNLGTFLFNTGTSVVTYIVTDGSGNSVTCSFTVVVSNATAGSIGGTVTVQQHPVNSSPVTFTGSGGQSPYTFTYTINGVAQPSVTSVGNTAIVQQSNAVLGNFAYQLTGISDANGCAGVLSPPATATITVISTGVPDLIVIPVQSSSQIGPGGTIQEVFTVRNIGTGPTTGPVTFTVNRFAPGSGLTATLNTALSVNIGFDNFTLHNNNEAGWSVVTTASTFTFTYTGVIATGIAGSKNVGITVTRGGPPIQGANGMSNQTATIPGGTGGGESPTSNNSATVTIVKN